MTLNELFTNIANAIRSKKGTTAKLVPTNFASEIESIESGGATVKTTAGWQGTTVPNSGYVENVYFNTNLSADEVVEILNSTESSEIPLIRTSDDTIFIVAMYIDDIPLIMDFITEECYFHNATDPELIAQIGFEAGWNPNISMPIVINSEVQEGGIFNDKLFSLFSTTPFIQETEQVTLEGEYDGSSIEITENGSLDVKALIENKQIPLSVNVNVESSGNIIEVAELPTENIQQDTVYKVNEISDIGVLFRDDVGTSVTLEAVLLSHLGFVPNITYLLVDEQPSNPNVSDLQTLSQIFIYIYTSYDVPYVYANMGNGNMWIEFKDVFNSVGDTNYKNRGYANSVLEMIEPGIYVTYKTSKLTYTNNKAKLCVAGEDYVDYKKLYEMIMINEGGILYDPNITYIGCGTLDGANIEAVYFPNLTSTNTRVFYDSRIKWANLPKLKEIDINLFESSEIESAYIPNAITISSSAFRDCSYLKAVIITQTNQICVLDGTTNFNFDSNLIYVPDSMVEQYKVATNWVVIASQIKGLSELPQQYKDLYGI